MQALRITGAVLVLLSIAFFLSKKWGGENSLKSDYTVPNSSLNTQAASALDDRVKQYSEGNDAYKPRQIILQFDQDQNILRNDPSNYFEQARILDEPDINEEESLRQVKSLLDQYVTIVKEGYPTGLNLEITNALLGKNSKKIALLSAAHSRINEYGELCDSWGSPYQFHNESMQEITIRSAGSDRELYTEDDIELKPSRL